MIIQTISIKSVTAQGMGTLSVFEGSHDVPFDIKRIYYIHGAPKGTHRGGHAHKALRQGAELRPCGEQGRVRELPCREPRLYKNL